MNLFVDNRCFQYACLKNNDIKMIIYILSVINPSISCLQFACRRKNNYPIIKYIIETGVLPNIPCLESVYKNNDIHAINYLMDIMTKNNINYDAETYIRPQKTDKHNITVVPLINNNFKANRKYEIKDEIKQLFSLKDNKYTLAAIRKSLFKYLGWKSLNNEYGYIGFNIDMSKAFGIPINNNNNYYDFYFNCILFNDIDNLVMHAFK